MDHDFDATSGGAPGGHQGGLQTAAGSADPASHVPAVVDAHELGHADNASSSGQQGGSKRKKERVGADAQTREEALLPSANSKSSSFP